MAFYYGFVYCLSHYARFDFQPLFFIKWFSNRCRCNVRIPSIVPLWDKWKEIFVVFQGPKLFNSLSPENHDAFRIDEFLSKPKSLIFSWCKLTVFYFFGAFSFFSSSSFFSLFHIFLSLPINDYFLCYKLIYCIGYLI